MTATNDYFSEAENEVLKNVTELKNCTLRNTAYDNARNYMLSRRRTEYKSEHVISFRQYFVITKWIYPFVTKGTDLSIFNSKLFEESSNIEVEDECNIMYISQMAHNGRRLFDVETGAGVVHPVYQPTPPDIAVVYMSLGCFDLHLGTTPNDDNNSEITSLINDPPGERTLAVFNTDDCYGIKNLINDAIHASTTYSICSMASKKLNLKGKNILDDMINLILSSELTDNSNIDQILSEKFEVTPGKWVGGHHVDVNFPMIRPRQ